MGLEINQMSELNKTENKYQRGKIYKLVSFETDKCYVGSTCESYLSNRLAGHRRGFRNYQNAKGHYITSFEILKYVDCDIILVESFACNTKEELLARERHWIESLNCVNKVIPTRSKKEYQQTDKIKAYQKAYRKSDGRKAYQQIHQEYNKAYRKKNRESLAKEAKVKVPCECGSECRRGDKARHLKSIKHLEYTKRLEMR